MRDLLREEAERGTTVFFSSHILPQVEAVCDRVGIMNEGRLVAEDTIEGLRESSDGSSQVTATVERIPEGLDLADLETLSGVERATADENSITAVCSDPSAKIDALKRIDEDAAVRDIHAEEASLEDLFNRYTDGASSETEAVDDGTDSADDAAERSAEVSA